MPVHCLELSLRPHSKLPIIKLFEIKGCRADFETLGSKAPYR